MHPQQAGAIFDVTATYRYSLWRMWSANLPRVVFIMLNPNRADAQHTDPTLRRCLDFATRWGFGSLEVVNLFAYRTSSPAHLRHVADPVGEYNELFVAQAMRRAACSVAAWGNYGTLLDRDRVLFELPAWTDALYCLGLTQEGHPRHPLYVRSTTSLMAYSMPLRRKTKKLRTTYR
jgi:hypothetical protein